MAKLANLVPLILKWEGGYVDDPADKGGPTNEGVTLLTWKQQGYDKNGDGVIDAADLKLMTADEMVERILRPHYWNRWQADRIDSQALANILVDWVWGSGRYGITIPQGILGVEADGIVGERTLHRLNAYPDPPGLFEKIKQMRRAYLQMICIDRPENRRFLKGWLNRLNDFRWIPLALLFCILFSCRTVKKTEMLTEKQTVETQRTTSLHTERQEQEEQNTHSSEAQNEIRTTETLTAVFDTLGSQLVLKEIRLSRTTSGRTVHAEQQAERRTVGTETVDGNEKVETQGTTSLHAESKEQPVRNPVVGWMVGAVAALALVGWLVLKFKKMKS